MQADFKVVLDACVLANAGVCDLFLRLAERPRLYLPLWSETILDEVHRTQTTKLKRPYSTELADYWRSEVNQAFPEAVVTGQELLLPVMTNHEKDRHVVAAAVKGGATLIVTFNLKHFPAEALKTWGVEACHPQDYLLTLLAMSEGVVIGKLAAIAKDHESLPQDVAIHLGKSVPAFSARVLEILGNSVG
jgi:predicted nucleic acid-binding protein